MNKFDFDGRTAIVTGGAKGIGYASADRLLNSGAAVIPVLVDNDPWPLRGRRPPVSRP